MNPVATRLTAFIVVLAGTFGTAYAIGEKAPGHSHETDNQAHDMSTHDTTARSPNAVGYRLVADLGAGTGTVGFHLADTAGDRVAGFAEAHGAQLHAVLVRPDLSGFQHIHPVIADGGTWEVPITESGPWHIVFEGVPLGTQTTVVVSTDIDDGAAFTSAPLPTATDSAQVDGLTVTLDRASNGFTFTVTPGDELEPYLGQAAHLIAIRSGDLAYQHLHADDAMAGMLMFGGTLDGPGTYRLFLQFGHSGSVVTVPFTVMQS